MADTHETGSETFVERAETFCTIDRLHGIEGMLISSLTILGYRLSLPESRHVSTNVSCVWLVEVERRQLERTMKRVLMTHNGLVTMVPVAPAVIAAVMCSQIELGGCSTRQRYERKQGSECQSRRAADRRCKLT